MLGGTSSCLEATGEAGGAVRTAELTAPGFRSDVFSAFYPLGVASPVLRNLGLFEFGLRWRHAPLVLAHLFEDGRAAVLSRDLDRTAESVESFAPGDGDAWRSDGRPVERHRRRRTGRAVPAVPAGPSRGPIGTATRHRGIAATRPDGGAAGSSRRAGTVLRRGRCSLARRQRTAHRSDSGGRRQRDLRLVARDARFDRRLSRAGGRRRRFDRGHERTAASSRGSTRLRRAGRCGAADRRPGDPASDWSTAARSWPDAPCSRTYLLRSFTAISSASSTCRPACGTIWTAFQWDAGTVKVDWALSAPPPWINPVAREAGTLHLGADLDGLTRYAADLTQRRVPAEPFLLFGQMTTADPSRSPAGTESAWAYTHVPRGSVTTEDELARHVQRIEDTVERHAPGFASSILARHVMGPADLQSVNPSLVGGSINGGTSALHQQLIFRPVTGLGRAETVVPGLFLASSSAHPGGGVHGGPGHNAALAALRDGPARRAVVRALHRRIYA